MLDFSDRTRTSISKLISCHVGLVESRKVWGAYTGDPIPIFASIVQMCSLQSCFSLLSRTGLRILYLDVLLQFVASPINN